MARARRFAIMGGLGLAVWLGLCLLIGIVATEGALHTPRRHISAADEALAREVSGADHAELTAAAIQGDDGATLRAWNFRLRNGNGDAVILLHGLGDNRAGMLGNAELLLQHGYSVLLPDSRAHGESDGKLVTYGLKEVDDVRRWYDWLERTESPHCIYGLGDSMGAAILLQTTERSPGLCAVVAESSFSTFREAAYLRLGQGVHAGSRIGGTLLRPAVDAGLLYARVKYGVNLAEASPEEVARRTHVPILLIHGLADTNLPAHFSEEIKANNPSIMLWEPVAAGHCGAATADPLEYERRVLGWFADHRQPGEAAN